MNFLFYKKQKEEEEEERRRILKAEIGYRIFFLISC